jgi:hypothetical protein
MSVDDLRNRISKFHKTQYLRATIYNVNICHSQAPSFNIQVSAWSCVLCSYSQLYNCCWFVSVWFCTTVTRSDHENCKRKVSVCPIQNIRSSFPITFIIHISFLTISWTITLCSKKYKMFSCLIHAAELFFRTWLPLGDCLHVMYSEVHYLVSERLPLYPILGQKNPVHILTIFSLKLILILSSRLRRSPKCTVPFRFPDQDFCAHMRRLHVEWTKTVAEKSV